MANFNDRTGEENVNKQGLKMKIIKYRGNKSLDIIFEDGTIVLDKSYDAFKRGSIRNYNYEYCKVINRVGEENINNYGSLMKIINYKNADNIDVIFPEYNYIVRAKQYSKFRNGSIKSPYDKSIFNVGYIGEGEFSSSNFEKGINKDNSKSYEIWYGMMKRCYDKNGKRYKGYGGKGVIVCEGWHNFQNFAKWYEENYYEVKGERMDLDKDILVKGNKIYSPKTCIFVPRRINTLFVRNDEKRGSLPIGVCSYKDKYRVVPIKDKFLGTFDTPEEAFHAYKIAKEKYIKEIADEYKDRIPKSLYNAMCSWEIEITD